MLANKPAISLIVLSLLGSAFFVLTDPRWGYGLWIDSAPRSNIVDAVHQMQVGTITGLAGCAIVLLVGIWLSLRRR